MHRRCMHCGMPARRYCEHENCQLGVGYCSKACGFADSSIHELEHNHRDPELVRSRQLRCDTYTMDVQIKRSQDARAEFQDALEQEAKRQKRPLTPEEQADFVFPRPPGSPGRGRRAKKQQQQRRERSPKRTVPQPKVERTENEVQLGKITENLRTFRDMMRALQEHLDLDRASREEIEACFDRMYYHCHRITIGNLWRKPNLNKHMDALEREGTLLHRLFSKGEIQEMHEPTLEETAAALMEIHLENTATELKASGPEGFTWADYDRVWDESQSPKPSVGVPYHMDFDPEHLITPEKLREELAKRNTRNIPKPKKRGDRVLVANVSVNGVPEPGEYIDEDELAARYDQLRALLMDPISYPTFDRVLARWKQIDELRASIPPKEWVLDPEFSDPLVPDYWIIDPDTKEISLNKGALAVPPHEQAAAFLRKALAFLDESDAGVGQGVEILAKAFEALPNTKKGRFAKACATAKVVGMTVSAAVGLWGTYQAVSSLWTPVDGRSVVDEAEEAVKQSEVFAEANEQATRNNNERIQELVREADYRTKVLGYMKDGLRFEPNLLAAGSQPIPLDSPVGLEATKAAVTSVALLPERMSSMITAGEGSLTAEQKTSFSALLVDRLEVMSKGVVDRMTLDAKRGRLQSDRLTGLMQEKIEQAFGDAVDDLRAENPGLQALEIPKVAVDAAWAAVIAKTEQTITEMNTDLKSDAKVSPMRVQLGVFSRLTEPARDFEARHPMTNRIYQKYIDKGLSPRDARVYTSLEAGQTAEHEKLANLAHDMMQQWEHRQFRESNLALLSATLSLTVVAVTMSAFSVTFALSLGNFVYKQYQWTKWLKRWINGETAPDVLEKEILDDYPVREGVSAADAIKLRRKIREYKRKQRTGDESWTWAGYREHLQNMAALYGWKPVLMNPVSGKTSSFRRITFSLGVSWAVQTQIWRVGGIAASGAVNFLMGLNPLEWFGAGAIATVGFALGATAFGAGNLVRSAKMTFGLFVGLPMAMAVQLMDEESGLSNVVDLYLNVFSVWKGVNLLQNAFQWKSIDQWLLENAAKYNSPALNWLLEYYNEFLVTSQTLGIKPKERFTAAEIHNSRAAADAITQSILVQIKSQPQELKDKAAQLMRPLELDTAWKERRSDEDNLASFLNVTSWKDLMKSLADEKADTVIKDSLGINSLSDNAFLSAKIGGEQLKKFATNLKTIGFE